VSFVVLRSALPSVKPRVVEPFTQAPPLDAGWNTPRLGSKLMFSERQLNGLPPSYAVLGRRAYEGPPPLKQGAL
jgi:hypothetical protein